jgi:hypothetical protein
VIKFVSDLRQVDGFLDGPCDMRKIIATVIVKRDHDRVHNRVNPTELYNNVYAFFAAGRWFSPSTPVSSTNKTDCHDIAEILLKVALNTITLTLNI